VGSIFADDASRRLDYDEIVEPVDIVICRQDLRWNLGGQCRGSDGGKWKKARDLEGLVTSVASHDSTLPIERVKLTQGH
jgi:hypothetical protein